MFAGCVMRIINRLARPGEIRSVQLSLESIVVRMFDDEVIKYRRIENEDVGGQESDLRRERRIVR